MRIEQLVESRADEWLEKYTLNGLDRFPNANIISELIKRYGNDKPLILYRGMNFSSKEKYDSFISSMKDGVLKTTSITSWSRDKEESMSFAITRPTYFINDALMSDTQAAKDKGETLIGYRGIILKCQVGAQQGIDVSKSPYTKEDEIILPPGHYAVSLQDVKKFSEMRNELDSDDIVIRTLVNDELSDEYLKKFAEYVVTKYPETLDYDTIKRLVSQHDGIELDKYKVGIVQNYDDPYYDKKLVIKFNPWLFKFLSMGILDSESASIVREKGKKLLNKVSSLVEKEGKVKLRASGIRQLSEFIDDGISYIKMLKMTTRHHDRNSKDINKLKGREKKDAISKEKDRLMAIVKDISMDESRSKLNEMDIKDSLSTLERHGDVSVKIDDKNIEIYVSHSKDIEVDGTIHRMPIGESFARARRTSKDRPYELVAIHVDESVRGSAVIALALVKRLRELAREPVRLSTMRSPSGKRFVQALSKMNWIIDYNDYQWIK